MSFDAPLLVSVLHLGALFFIARNRVVTNEKKYLIILSVVVFVLITLIAMSVFKKTRFHPLETVSECGICDEVFFGSKDVYQARAESEATEMMMRRYKGHIGDTIGDFEGCGWSSNPSSTPSTCIPPSRNYSLVADAIARDSSGAYRVRAWIKNEKSPNSLGRKRILSNFRD